MTSCVRVMAIVTAAGLAAPALAQDSVSNIPDPQPAGASDALNPWNLDKDLGGGALQSNQTRRYCVAMTPFTSSWGTEYQIGVLAKSSKTDAAFESSLIGAQAISRCIVDGPPVLPDFPHWVAPGSGINGLLLGGGWDGHNDPPAMATPSLSTPSQFGYAFTEFSGNYNGVIGGLVNTTPADTSIVWVTRTVAATNGLGPADDTATFGLGSVSAGGQIYFRGDEFGAGAGSIMGSNIFEVDVNVRDPGIVNNIFGDPTMVSDPGATALPINGAATAHSTPNLVPFAPGLAAAYIGTNFNNEYVFNDGVSTTMAHLAGATDQRGTLAFSWRPLLGNAGAFATGGTLSKSAGANTDSFSIWDMDMTGAIVGAAELFTAPVSLSDNCNGYTWPTFAEFDHYHSQVAFQGGNSPLGLGSNADGDLLAVAVAYRNGGNTDAENAIVALHRPTGGAPSFSMVAYNGDFNFVFSPAGRGKDVTDGAGTRIGSVATLLELTNGAVLGPSMSGAALDAMGNVWFVAPVDYAGVADPVDPANIDATLIRAVYGEDAAGQPCWELEAVLRGGDVFTGRTSLVDYQIGFISIADSNSVSSGTFWSQNVIEQTFFNVPKTTLQPRDNRSTHGVLLSASITYDRNGDGTFSTTAEDTGDGDESYNVVLYIAPNAVVGAPCSPNCADATGDGVVNIADLNLVLANFDSVQAVGTNGDVNCDGIVNIADLNLVLAQWQTTCTN